MSPESLSPGASRYSHALAGAAELLDLRDLPSPAVGVQVSFSGFHLKYECLNHAHTLGTTFPFAFTLVELLFGKEKRDEVVGPMVFPPGTWA